MPCISLASSVRQVIAPAPGGPADRAGIRPQDEVLAIDGRAAADISLYEFGALLQGAKDSQAGRLVA